MPSVYKPKADRDRRDRPWSIIYTGPDGKRVYARGFTDKRLTLEYARKLEDEARLIREGVIDPRTARLRKNRRIRLPEHIADYDTFLRNKGVTEDHRKRTVWYLEQISRGAGWTLVDDINADGLLGAIAVERSSRKLSARSTNARIVAWKSFTRWLTDRDRIPTNPLRGLSKRRESDDRRRRRRALSAEEVHRLLDAAAAGPAVSWRRAGASHALSGEDRAMLYRVMLDTGLRLGEVTSLTPGSFRLDEPGGPVVRVAAGYSKRRRDEVQPLPRPLAADLAGWLVGKPENEPLWPRPYNAVERLLKPDLERADVPYRDADERQADFHAFRHTYITRLALSDVPLAVAQKLARHASPVLTANVYTHVELDERRSAIDRVFGSEKSRGETGPGAGESRTEAESAAYLQQSAQRTGRNGSPGVSAEGPAPGTAADPKPLSDKAKTATGRASARPATSRGGEIRTPDLLTPSQAR